MASTGCRIDSSGNIIVNGRGVAMFPMLLNDGNVPIPNSIDATTKTVYLEVPGLIRTRLLPITGATAFTASITGTAMTVSAVSAGALGLGDIITGAAGGTQIIGIVGTPEGGPGTYTVSISQNVTSRGMNTVVNSTVLYLLDAVQLAALPLNSPISFLVRDETVPALPVLLWEGNTITVTGYTGQPPTGPA